MGANATEIWQGVLEQELPWVRKKGDRDESTTCAVMGSLLKLVTEKDWDALIVPRGV